MHDPAFRIETTDVEDPASAVSQPPLAGLRRFRLTHFVHCSCSRLCLFLLRMRFCDSCVPVRPVATSAYRTYAPPFVFRRGNPLVLRLRPSIGSSLSTDLSIVNRIAVTVSSVGKPMSFLSPVESPFRPQSARLVTHPNLFVPAVMTASHQFTLFHVLNCFLNYFLRWPWLPNWKRP